MDHPPPHAFSRSPVQEVFCVCTLGSGTESLSLAIAPPYPGWPYIREKIGGMIADAGDTPRITGCTLRYTDLLPVPARVDLPGIEELEHLLSPNYNCETRRNEIVLTSTTIPGTRGSVRSINNQGKPVWTLIFTMHTERSGEFLSSDSVLNWFDDARAGIHGLFDLIVPDKIVQLLR